ncbi:Ribosomal RNA-processing 42 [Hyphodiscus hymeniophilus]|uniref:Ribosomal RNA-processing protein 42 n=1 Tax=Hyphodiscus hymeniophilus TaxID=353542 RepID=A0A9P6VEB0_9HELO|nr:Ribosomal RNA-processing 42 [Hyphodiscus hymeniophilus]
MAPSSTQQILLSPAELSYIHTSLSLSPPIRPDARTASQFRPLVAETDILPSTNGSARICFADGTEAIVGIKAEVEKSRPIYQQNVEELDLSAGAADDEDEDDEVGNGVKGLNEWVELSVEIPGFRDDDSMPVFLSAMLSEALLADGDFTKRLWINRRFHWKLYLDILLLSQPLSYPLPLLSLTTHLALLSTRLPKLKSELDEDPLFDDDWDASEFLYPRAVGKARTRPPVTLLVMAVQENIIFDPSKEELAVAEVVLAVSIGEMSPPSGGGSMEVDSGKGERDLRLLAIRTIDPPSRLTHSGVPNTLNTATGGSAAGTSEQNSSQRESVVEEGVWQPPRGGAKRKLIAAMISKVLERGGVAEEVLDGLDAVELG